MDPRIAPYDFALKDHVSGVNLKRLNLTPDSLILDYGCGSGQFTRGMAPRGYRLVAADMSEASLEELRSVLEQNPEWRVRLSRINPDEKRLPYRDRRFDVVVCREVLEHVADYGGLLAEFRRILKRNGILVLSTPTPGSERLFRFFDARWLEKCDHINIFRKRDLAELGRRKGFALTTVKGKSFFWAFNWFFLSLARTDHFMGRIKNPGRLLQALLNFWKLLYLLRLKGVVERIGDMIFPKSYFYYFLRK